MLCDATDKENFVSMALLTGKTFESDSEKVHICLRPLLTKHSDALSVVEAARMDSKCGRTEWLALVRHCQGSGMHLSEVLKAKDAIQNLHCGGENPPHVDWCEFESSLNDAHAVVRRKHGETTPEETKVRSLLKRIRDPDLNHIHPMIIARMEDKPNCTHLQAMADVKKDVVRRHPNSDDKNENTRQVKQTTAKKHQNCKHQNNRG